MTKPQTPTKEEKLKDNERFSFYVKGVKEGKKQRDKDIYRLFDKYDFIDKEIYEKELGVGK